MEIFLVLYRTLFFYFFIVFLYRIMGKREIGQLGIIDLIVSILIAEMVAISIENIDQSIWMTIIPLIVLVILEVGLAYISTKSRKFRTFFAGKPSLIICRGKINLNEMVKQRYNMDDLLLSLRQKEVKSIEEVEYAFLESNGKLSVFKYNFFRIKSQYPMPVILDGIVQETTLKAIHKNEYWLRNILKKKNMEPENIFYAFLKKKQLFLIQKKDL